MTGVITKGKSWTRSGPPKLQGCVRRGFSREVALSQGWEAKQDSSQGTRCVRGIRNDSRQGNGGGNGPAQPRKEGGLHVRARGSQVWAAGLARGDSRGHCQT